MRDLKSGIVIVHMDLVYMCRNGVFQLQSFIKCLAFNWQENCVGERKAIGIQSNTVDWLCGVRACLAVYVDNAPCAGAPPFPIFMELCLPLLPWQQKVTNSRSVETPVCQAEWQSKLP